MKQETIEQLLERYWDCETSQEEERRLSDSFSNGDIPDNAKKYQALFAWKQAQAQLKGSKKLKSGFHKTPVIRFYPIMKIAASVLLVLTVGIGFYTRYEQEKFMDEIFAETYSNPEDALQETKEVIGKVSSVLQLAKDRKIKAEITDSLEINKIQNKIK
ncbi:MAG: hypothetical protein LBU22_12055 [Dysgonamonadaceae bacterium]|jgi:hypothetical protein|nr:hypothetical protein [Dysgonamonadaceae bacterium]